MKKLFIYISLGLLFNLSFAIVLAQTYNMSNQTVSDCNGTLTDSNNGTNGNYAHNENLIFSICPSGADSIILSFSSFCTELNLDEITFFDGPNTSSPVIGTSYSGNTTLPPNIIALSGCLTIQFVSDASVACSGWDASWQTIINTPTNPTFTATPLQNCNTTSITLTLDQNVTCSSLSSANFNIFGPLNQSITNITPVNCVNNLTNTFTVDFSPGTAQNGTYQMQLDATFVDDCNNTWDLSSFGSFTVENCPISAEIIGNDTICLGECTTLSANAWDGNGNYSYQWNNGLSNTAGPHNVCPTTTTTYQVTVTDGSSAPAAQASKTIYVIQPVTMPANFTICQSDPPVDLDATPNTGYWTGPGFGNDTMQGIFKPYLVGSGVHTITFHHFSCEDTMSITVTPMSIWTPNYLLCPNSSPVSFSTNNPGGTYSGNGIIDNVNGIFDPSIAGIGTHSITYSNPPCTDKIRNITVGTPTIQNDDTICSNSGLFEPLVSPKGGAWSYPSNPAAITNWYHCRFDPLIAGIGTHELLYTYGDCVDTLKVTVFGIEAGNSIVKCVSNPPFNITGASPPGGTWSGVGITDAINGTFNPNHNSGANFNSWVYYTANGCTDSLRIYVRNTEINTNPLPSFCSYDSDFTLNYANSGRTPWNGSWSGNGIVNSSANGIFSPSAAGAGTHTIIYEANNCIDSAAITVLDIPNISDTSVCIEQSAFDMPNNLTGGQWNGNGIVNPINGTFLASAAGVGTHTLEYITADNCYYYISINVTDMPIVSLNGLPTSWCFADTNFILDALPINGAWSGTTNDSIFNPINSGSGNFTISYSIGTGECQVSTSTSISIDDTLNLIPYFIDTTICKNDYIRIGALGTGGQMTNYAYAWNNGLGSSFENIVQPNTSTSYTITLNDGCSQTATATLNVNLQPEFTLSFETSHIQCYDIEGFVKVNVSPTGNYTYLWNNDNTNTSNVLNAKAGHQYKIIIKDSFQCEQEEFIEIPAYNKIIADYTLLPKNECLDLLNSEVYIIDQSIGGILGTWHFADGEKESYNPNEGNISHEYNDTGTYKILLSIENEGGCSAIKEQTICVKPKTYIKAPTAFSPNNDGKNDFFLIHSLGVGDNNTAISILNRWGETVFYSEDIGAMWDGTHKNKKMPVGTYTWQVIFYSLEKEKIKTEKGTFELIR